MGLRTSKVPEWLFEESYHIVGDLAETIALSVRPKIINTPSLSECITEIINLKSKDEKEKELYLSVGKVLMITKNLSSTRYYRRISYWYKPKT